MATLKNTTITGTGYIRIPSGTGPQRPSPATAGQTRFNTDSGLVETYDGSAWVNNINQLVDPPEGTPADRNGNVKTNFKVQYFTSTGAQTFTVPTGVSQVHVLIVGGGGSGGQQVGGGGGAGGMVEANHYPVTPGGSVPLFVGAGGPAPAFQPSNNASNNGQPSYFGLLTANGGGYGGNHSGGGSGAANPGGSGGGGGGGPGGNANGGQTQIYGGLTDGTNYPQFGAVGWGFPGGTGTSGGGWAGGGGGGAAGKGENSTNNQGGSGGIGRISMITGSSQYYAGGGGGSVESPGLTQYGRGGAGGGGMGASIDNGKATQPGINGRPGTGGGGGGTRDHPSGAGQGGPGIVIVRY